MTKRTAVSLLVLLFVAQGVLPTIAIAGESGQSETQMRVVATSLNVRSGPSTTNAVVSSLSKGAVVTIVEDRGDWKMIRLEDGTLGWAASKFLEVVPSDEMVPSNAEPAREGSQGTKPAERRIEEAAGGSGGGSAFRGILKWGSLVGAAACGGLALSERSKGDSAYDDYKSLFGENRKDEAEVKYQDAKDHDSKAQTFAIVGGGLFGLFLLQQFVFTGGGDEVADLGSRRATPAFAWSPATGEMRAALMVRF
jgi:uncharacterized protein YgiM (DUF1202 family)